MKSSRLIFELDHICTINSILVDYLHAMNRFSYYYVGAIISIKRIE